MKHNPIYVEGSEEEYEFMPILPLNEDFSEDSFQDDIPSHLPILPLRNTVLFPGVILPITVGREKSVKAVEGANLTDKLIGVVAQKDSNIEDPSPKDLARIGTVARIIKLIRMPDGGTTIIIQGRQRFAVKRLLEGDSFFTAQIQLLDDIMPDSKQDINEFNAYSSSIKDLATQIINLSPHIPNEATVVLNNIEKTSFLIHFVASNLSTGLEEKQQLLEINNLRDKADFLMKLLQTELQLAELKNKITTKTKSDLDRQQREYFLQQQLKSIKEELGGDSNDREIRDLEKRAEAKIWPDAARQAFKKNLSKLERIHPSTPDYSVIYNNLDLMLDLPWQEYTEDKYDLERARKVLDRNHYDMDKIKDRIIEYLAVLKLKGDMKSPILCFVGPPGIGKTSLGKSIADAIHRKYIRLSLGGVHDESEIRGHRKTYIGAMPGRIIQSIRKVKSSNPVMVLDEIDKVGSDFRGDPSSALLEVLDPEQNSTFYDNYLELEYDLSRVLFIATANSLNGIHPALRDRLEIIELSGYAVEEKVEIAKRHLVPKQKRNHGLSKLKMTFPKKVIEQLIQDYTRESGVRELDRQLAGIMRSLAKKVATNEKLPTALKSEMLPAMLGKPRFGMDMYKASSHSGVAVGLAWTYVGGDILFIETSLSEGKGELKLTGNLGNVMKESASTALSYLRAHAEELGINPKTFDHKNIHIHVPEGAVPKDGPSAGITMLSALTSAFKDQSIRPYLAMTGEITLRGQVLPVGGIKEKILAAKRAGLKEIILCQRNEKDIEEINKRYIKGLKFHYVDQMEEVLAIALTKPRGRRRARA